MILYNVTCLIDPELEEEWVQWMVEVHIPEVMNTEMFVSHRIFRIDAHEAGDSGVSYAIQYYAETRAHYLRYIEEFAPGLKSKTLARYGEKVLAFRTVMEEV